MDTIERPVFDVANDNRASKPLFLDPIDTPSRDDDTPTGTGSLSTVASKEAARKRRLAEAAEMQLAKTAIEARQRIGNPDAANDNEYWPLMSALRRDRDNDSINFILKYRRLVAVAECEPLQGQRVAGGELEVERRSTNLGKDAKAALAAMKEDDAALGGGEIRYRETRRRKGGTFHLPAKRAIAVNDETRVRTAAIAQPFNCDLLIAKIDAKTVLAELRQALGAVLDSFEDAVLGGQSYSEIGSKAGFHVKPDVAGKALVHAGIIAAEGALHDIQQRIRRNERQAERRASARRCEIAVAKAAYLGRAA